MRTHQFTLAFLQVTEILPEEMQRLVLKAIVESDPPSTPPPTPRKPIRYRRLF